ncbi:hypothetical protein ABW21_db0200804 [Orbilia brochopaga]|nr:hypothetical protein ABW21_db0200804 [Drechslerella brochopaga]
MRLSFSTSLGLCAFIFCLAQAPVTADIIKVARTDWFRYETENYEILRAILFNVDNFKFLRSEECAIENNGPIENPQSLNYLLDTINEAASKFSDAISDIERLNSTEATERKTRLAALGVLTTLEARTVLIRLQFYHFRLEHLRDLLSDAEVTLDMIPNGDFPTTVLDQNIHALAMYIHDARLRGGNLDTGIVDIDTYGQGKFLQFLNELIKQAEGGVEMLQAAEEYSAVRFGQAFTEFIADRDPRAPDYPQMTEEERAESAYTVESVFYEMRRFFQCWLLRTEMIVNLVPRLSELPDPLEAPFWLGTLEGDPPDYEDISEINQLP